MLELRGIQKKFHAGTENEAVLFENFSFRIKKGEFVSIIGSNGSGKTTLLSLVCGSQLPDKGSIIFGGKDITAESEHKRYKAIARVHQDPKMGTCSGLTVLENMALADNKGKTFGLSKGINKNRIPYYKEQLALCNMGLENRLNATAGSLSGGQRQALALVLVNMNNDAELLVLDEHTAALDPKSSETLMQLTDKFIARRGVSTLMVTHNLRHALTYGDRLVMMNDGKIVMDLANEEKAATNLSDLMAAFNQIIIK